MNTSNNKTGASEPVNSVTVACVKTSSTDATANAVEVQVNNSRAVKTAIAGVIGIDKITPNSYAVARYFRSQSPGGLRPWAVCSSTALAAKNTPDKTFWTGIDWMPGGSSGPCSTTAAGDWGAVDFNNGSNGAGDLADWTLYGYPNPVAIPDPAMPGDPGVSNKSELKTAFASLVGKTVLFPAVNGFTCGGSNCNGSNAQFDTVGITTVRVCGIVYGNNTYNVDQTTSSVSDCWIPPSPPTFNSTTGPVLSATTAAVMAAGSKTLTVTAPVFPAPPVDPAVTSVTVTVPGAAKVQGNPAPLVATVSSFTSTTTVDLSAVVAYDVPAGTPITFTVTTTTPSGGFGPYALQGNTLVLKDHIQFRYVDYSTSSYPGTTVSPCDFTNQLCVGVTQLWK